MKSMANRLAPFCLCLPFCGVLFGFLVASALAQFGIAPIGAGVYGIMVFSACSVCGLVFAIAEARALHRIDGLTATAILVNGFFVVPGLVMLISILFSK
jgi:hypothetical protein